MWMRYWVGVTFESPQIPSNLGFKDVRDGTGYHIGYKESSHIHSTLTSQNLISDYPADISAGTQIMFIYLDIIRYQIVGYTKAPLLGVIDTNRRVKNGYACSIEPNHRKVFSNLDYKKLLVNNIQSIAVDLRTEIGRLVPFAGEGEKVDVTLKFQNFLIKIMDAYYHNQATMPLFSGHYRQRGCGSGALAMVIGRVALPLARKFIVPAAKRIGK